MYHREIHCKDGVDETSSESCPVVGFGISNVEPLGSAARKEGS